MKENHIALGRYILITPDKNEERSLPGLIQSVVKQTIKPTLWVIVDDGSTDTSPEIIKDAKEEHRWIQSIQLNKSMRDIGKHYAYVCRKGFDFSYEYCKVNSIQYEYIGLIDADMILEPGFCYKLINEFEKNPKLGIASGGIYYNNGLIWEEGRQDLPRGGARIWRRKCFEETGGYFLTYSPDSVSNIKAKLKGWETKQFKEIKAIQTRKTSSAEGFWKGYKAKGVSAYFVNTNPILAMLRGIDYLFKKPYHIGLAYLWGYFSSFLWKREQIDDEEISEYFHKNKPQEVRQYYFNLLKNKFKRRR